MEEIDKIKQLLLNVYKKLKTAINVSFLNLFISE